MRLFAVVLGFVVVTMVAAGAKAMPGDDVAPASGHFWALHGMH